MRLLITVESMKDCSHVHCYGKMRGFVYSLQKESPAFNKHNASGYKLFTFSNIFPAQDVKSGETRYFQISSPLKDLMYYLKGRLGEMQEKKIVLNIGEYQFLITSVRSLHPVVTSSCELITGTPIVLRIPNQRYEEYGISSLRSYEYWRPDYDFSIFVKQLTDNLIKKHKQFSGKVSRLRQLFEEFTFKKSVSVVVAEEGRNIPVIGSVWKFRFHHMEEEQQRILQLGLDAGFGEMNSSGFGFMNKVIMHGEN
ncbi:CRISPR-associated endoribonuclease Cas6 [Candidatus Woesearchaeota archaeon]|nr:CRISPR-associated endoribonuclease Cas6 [Candidatus Woesearchaeota archaeon]